MKTKNGVEIARGAQVLLRGVTPMILFGRPMVAGLWRPGPSATGTTIWRSADQIVRDTDATLDKHARYPRLKERDLATLRSGHVVPDWEVSWWIEPNTDPATHIDYEALTAAAHEIYSSSEIPPDGAVQGS